MPVEDYEPYEEEWDEPDAELWPDQELALAGRFRRRFTTKAQLSPELELHAAEGTRAAVIPLRPGLYLVAEVSEQALAAPNMGGTEVGAIAIATAAMTAARAALNIRKRRQEQGKEPLVRELRDRLADGSLRERLQVVRDRMQSGQGLVARFRDGDGPLRDRLFDHPRPGVTIPAGQPGALLPEPIPAWAEPEDQAALGIWARDHLVPAHDQALRQSCLVLPEMQCLEVLSPRPLPHYARGKALAQHSVEDLGFKQGLRYVTNDLVEMVEDPVVPEFPPEFAYGVSKAHRWPLLDEQEGCVIVPMDGFDVVVSMNLMHHHLAPMVLPPMKTFLDLIGVEATGNPFHNLQEMAPYAAVVSDLRGLGARFLTELDREGLERLAGRPLKRAKK
ncbi:MAG: hypothetical protein GY884_34860 [Proteobacteria bacterium]|nr:hypothetical protein [Pseudomonadota bacterium]